MILEVLRMSHVEITDENGIVFADLSLCVYRRSEERRVGKEC